MEAQTRSPDGQDAAARRCDACETQNIASARYCKQCGASFSPPPACPACTTELPREARFCPSCGLKVVGLRPVRESAAPPPKVEAAAPAPAPAPPVNEQIKALTDNLPKVQPRSRGSNMLGNVLLFVAALAVFVVVMYVVNKDAAKEVSPFVGGPPPMGSKQPAEQQPAKPNEQPVQAAAGGGDPITGTIKIAPDLSATTPSGTVFVILRMAGMPDRGPPVAVKKYERPNYPLEFELNKGDVMMQGMPFEGPFDVYVRLDVDGNAMTKAPGDLVLAAPKSGVKAGDKAVELILDKRL